MATVQPKQRPKEKKIAHQSREGTKINQKRECTIEWLSVVVMARGLVSGLGTRDRRAPSIVLENVK